MVTRSPHREQIVNAEFADTRLFLAKFGIAERELDQYHFVEDDVLRAIRARGWEPSIQQEDEVLGWKAVIQEWRTVSQGRSAIGRDHARTMALLRALRIALTWTTPEEEFEAFNEQTVALVGLTADEFLQKWENNELSTDDPRVIHLLIARPLGR